MCTEHEVSLDETGRPLSVSFPQAGVPVCEYLLDPDTAADAADRARELLGDRLVAPDVSAADAEEGERLAPPAAPWNPLQEQVVLCSSTSFCGW